MKQLEKESLPKTKTSHFEDEFVRRTTKRRRDLRGREFMGSVAMAILKKGEHLYRLTYIETLPLLRSNGNASLAIAWLCTLADEYDVTLELCPVPLDDFGLDMVHLTAWYQKFGFVRIGMKDEMVRQPKRIFKERKENVQTTT